MKTQISRSQKLWWIKERYNPQLGIYYVACGQMSEKDAKRQERPTYGENVMVPFESETDYQAKIKALKKTGQRVQSFPFCVL